MSETLSFEEFEQQFGGAPVPEAPTPVAPSEAGEVLSFEDFQAGLQAYDDPSSIDQQTRARLEFAGYRLPEAEQPRAITRGLKGGWSSLKSIYGGAVAATGDLLGIDDMRAYGTDLFRRYQEEAAQRFGYNPTLEDVFASDDMLGDFSTWLGVSVGQGAATSVPILMSFLVNPALGWAATYSMGVGETYGAQLGESEDPNEALAFAAGVPYAVAERLLGMGGRLGMMFRKGGGEVSKSFITRLAKEAVKTPAEEAVAEYIQEGLGIGAAGLEAGKPLAAIYGPEQRQQMLEAAARGAAGGMAFAPLAAAPGPSKKPAGKRPSDEARTAPPEDEAAPDLDEKPGQEPPQAAPERPQVRREPPPLRETPDTPEAAPGPPGAAPGPIDEATGISTVAPQTFEEPEEEAAAPESAPAPAPAAPTPDSLPRFAEEGRLLKARTHREARDFIDQYGSDAYTVLAEAQLAGEQPSLEEILTEAQKRKAERERAREEAFSPEAQQESERLHREQIERQQRERDTAIQSVDIKPGFYKDSATGTVYEVLQTGMIETQNTSGEMLPYGHLAEGRSDDAGLAFASWVKAGEVKKVGPPGPTSTPEEIAAEEAKVEPEPSEAQAEQGNYAKGHIQVQGLDITIETPKGGTRRGKTEAGEPWEVVSPAHYGYIRRTVGADEEQVDVYLGDDPASDRVFVVDQVDPESGTFDEHKAIIGVRSQEEAEDIYRGGFSDGRGGERMGAISEMSMGEFQGWLESGEPSAPFALEAAAPTPEEIPEFLQAGPPPPPPGFEVVEPAVVARPQRARTPRAEAPQESRQGRFAEFVASEGGVQDQTGELRAMDAHIWHRERPFRKKLVRAEGRTPDMMRERAEEEGFLPPGSDLADFYALLDESLRGPNLAERVPDETENRYRMEQAGADVGLTDESMAGMTDENLVTAIEELDRLADTEEEALRTEAEELFDDVDSWFPPTKAESVEKPPRRTEGQAEPAGPVAEAEAVAEGGGPAPAERGGETEAGRPAEREAPATELTDQGEQEVIPGAEKISDRKLAERRMQGRKRSEKEQKSADEGLFDVAGRGQKTLFSQDPGEPTKRWTEKNAQIVERVQALARRIVPGADVRVVKEIFSVFDHLTAEEQADLKRLLPKATGFYLPAKQLIAVALNASDPIHVLRHEAIHALRAMGMFTDKEWALLSEQADRSWIAEFNIKSRYPNDTLEVRREEASAEAFGHWQKGKLYAPGYRRIFQRIADFLKSLGNMLRGMGFNTVDKIFQRVESGEVGRRPGRQATAEAIRYHIEDNLSSEEQATLASMRGKVGAKKQTVKEKIAEKISDNLIRRMKQGVADGIDSLNFYERMANQGELYEDSRSSYKLARLSRGINEFLHASFYYGAPMWKEGTFTIDTSVKAPMQIIHDVGAEKLEYFQLFMIGKRSQENAAAGKENLFDPEEVNLGLKMGALFPEFEQHWADLQTHHASVVDFMQASGMLSEKTRAFFDEMHKNYVPYHRLMEEKPGKVVPKAQRAKMGFAGQHPAFFKLKGGEQHIDQPLLNWERNLYRVLEMSIKNVVMLRAEQINAELGYAFMKPKARTAKRVLVNNKQMIDALAAQGLEISSKDGVNPESLQLLWSFGHAPTGRNMVSWLRGGEIRYAEIFDPLMYRSLTMLAFKPFHWGFGILKFPKHLLTKAVGLDPTYQFRNITRDTVHVAATSKIGFIPGVHSIKGMRHVATRSNTFREMMYSGAAQAAFFESEAPKLAASLEGKLGHTSAKILWTPKRWLKMLERFESSFEYATRVGVFEKLRSEGVPLMEAAYQARDLATDFGMRGDWLAIRILTEYAPFLNAGIQGLYRTGRGFAANKLNFLWKGAMLASIAVFFYMLNRDDERFKALTEQERDSYMHHWIGDLHIKAPKPFEIGTFFLTIPERMAELMMEGRGKRFLDRMWWNIGQTFRLDPTPQIIKPAMQVAYNWDDFRERPIVPPWLQETRSPAEQYGPRTSTTMIAAGRALDVAPAKLQKLIDGHFGAWGGYLTTAADTLYELANPKVPARPAIPWQDFPVVRAFVGPKVPHSSRYVEEFYEMKKEVDQLAGSIEFLISQGEVKRAEKLMKEGRGRQVLKPVLNRIASQMARLRKVQNLIRINPTMTAQEKREQIDKLQVAIFKIAAQVEPLQLKFE